MIEKLVYLASNSPRRQQLLKQINIKYQHIRIEFDELVEKYDTPLDYSIQLSQKKLSQAKDYIDKLSDKNPKSIVITADTIVTLNNHIYEKPKDQQDALRILKELSGQTHQVITTYSLYDFENKNEITRSVITDVTFWDLDDNQINEYIKTGSPMDKAGAYGIQDDYGAVFIKKIYGCYYNVVGLPISYLYKDLKTLC